MRWAISATLGVVAALAVPATSTAADSVIVKYKAGATAESRSAAAKRAGVGESLGTVAATGAKVVKVSGDASAAAETLSRSATVEYAEPNVELHALATPNDARFGELYGLHNANDADMDAPEGWDLAQLGGFPASGGVKVGIVDTGIDNGHEDLVGQDGRVRERPAAHQPRHRGHLHRPERSRHARRGHDRREGQQRRRRRRRLLPLAVRDLPRAQRGRLRDDGGRRQLHHLPRRQGCEGHLDVARRRLVDDAADRRAQRHQRAAR